MTIFLMLSVFLGAKCANTLKPKDTPGDTMILFCCILLEKYVYRARKDLIKKMMRLNVIIHKNST